MTQVNIRQLQGTLDTYFAINSYIWQHLIVRLLFQAKCYSDLHYWGYITAVWSPVHPHSCLNFTLMCLTTQFTLMHQVMKGTCIQSPCKSSMWPCIHHSMCVCQELLTRITYYHKTHFVIYTYLETVAKLSKWFLLYCALRKLVVS